MNAPTSQSVSGSYYNSIISKRGIIRKQELGINPKYTQNDQLIRTRHISSSIVDERTDIYYYDIELINHTHPTDAGKLRFRQSNGVEVHEMTSSTVVADGNYHHISLNVSSSGVISLQVDNTVESTVDRMDIREDVHNQHSLVFGALDRTFAQGFSGSLDEIRIYNTSLSDATIGTLANSSSMDMYQTAVVGNVFYRKGNIVVSPLQPSYLNAFNDTWSLDTGEHIPYFNMSVW